MRRLMVLEVTEKDLNISALRRLPDILSCDHFCAATRAEFSTADMVVYHGKHGTRILKDRYGMAGKVLSRDEEIFFKDAVKLSQLAGALEISDA